MTNNENLSKRDMYREQKRNDDKLRSLNQMYGKSAILEADFAESEAKLAKMLKLTGNTDKSVHNDSNDSEAVYSRSVQGYIDLLDKVGKIDPNQAFIKHKNRSRGPSIEDVIDSLRKDI